MNNKKCTILTIIGLIIVFIINIITFNTDVLEESTELHKIKEIEVLSYNLESNNIKLSVKSTKESEQCATNKDPLTDNIEFNDLEEDSCVVEIPMEEQYIYFKNADDIEEPEALELDNYLIDIKLKDKYYLALNDQINIINAVIKVGDPLLEWKITGESIDIVNGLVITKSVGNAKLEAIYNGEVYKTIDIVVTNTITQRPTMFNESKPYLGCQAFTQEEAHLLDETLEYFVAEAGYGTRAGVVEAARFLTLSFPYRISYYWENGRLHPSGVNYVDGEGRYYHKGLYLSVDKYQIIQKKMLGPQMWGCNMTNLEEDPPYFIRNKKYPNGLDCSGFVAWTLLNGGFDVGDKGAGNSGYRYELTDLGEFTRLTKDIIYSGRIKVGDLFNFDGHVAILIGMDDNTFYIAESLNTLGGVVLKAYPKSEVNRTFTYVVFMDSLYKNDGNLTDMWY